MPSVLRDVPKQSMAKLVVIQIWAFERIDRAAKAKICQLRQIPYEAAGRFGFARRQSGSGRQSGLRPKQASIRVEDPDG